MNNRQERKTYWITEVIADDLQHRRLTADKIAPDEMISIELDDAEAIRDGKDGPLEKRSERSEERTCEECFDFHKEPVFKAKAIRHIARSEIC